MAFEILPFNVHLLNQLELLPPKEWQSNAYELFLHNEWQPWFFPYQVVSGSKLLGFGMFFLFEDVAWLGWILVHHKYRNKGIGSAISIHLTVEAGKMGAKNFILTATELGRPIYEKLGFQIKSYYRFFNTPELFQPKYDKSKIRSAKREDLSMIIRLDMEATGEKRDKLIENQLEECFVYDDNEIGGFYLPNLGNGFVVAKDNKIGIELLKYRLKRNKKSIAVPDQNSFCIDYLLKNGFTEGSKIPRMVLGEPPNWKPTMIFSRAAGYCG